MRLITFGKNRQEHGLAAEDTIAPSVVVAPGPLLDPAHRDRLGKHREFYLKSAHTVTAASAGVAYRPALGTISYRAQLGLVLSPTPRHTPSDRILDRVMAATVVAEVYSMALLRIGWEGTMWHVRYGEGASFDSSCITGLELVSGSDVAFDGLILEDVSGVTVVDPDVVAEFLAYMSRWMELGPDLLVLAGSSHGPTLSVNGDDPVIRFGDSEPKIGPGDRIWARCAPLGEFEAIVHPALSTEER